MKIEEVFFCKGIVKLITTLIDYGELNISQLVRLSNINHKQVNKYITTLLEKGFVREKRFGRIRIIESNLENKYMRLLSDFIMKWKLISHKED